MKYLLQIPGREDKVLDSKEVNVIIVSDKAEALGGKLVEIK